MITTMSDLNRLVDIKFETYRYKSGDKQTLIQCNCCQTVDIGKKYKCAVCVDYDECEKCHDLNKLKKGNDFAHNYETHPFYKVEEGMSMKLIR